jgi:hypothetical protein
MVDLYEWINTVTPAEFPPVPFPLAAWLTMNDVELFITVLRRDISENNYRVKTGAVNSDLRMLYDAVTLLPSQSAG